MDDVAGRLCLALRSDGHRRRAGAHQLVPVPPRRRLRCEHKRQRRYHSWRDVNPRLLSDVPPYDMASTVCSALGTAGDKKTKSAAARGAGKRGGGDDGEEEVQAEEGREEAAAERSTKKGAKKRAKKSAKRSAEKSAKNRGASEDGGYEEEDEEDAAEEDEAAAEEAAAEAEAEVEAAAAAEEEQVVKEAGFWFVRAGCSADLAVRRALISSLHVAVATGLILGGLVLVTVIAAFFTVNIARESSGAVAAAHQSVLERSRSQEGVGGAPLNTPPPHHPPHFDPLFLE